MGRGDIAGWRLGVTITNGFHGTKTAGGETPPYKKQRCHIEIIDVLSLIVFLPVGAFFERPL